MLKFPNNNHYVECSGPGAVFNNGACSCTTSNSTINTGRNACECDLGYETSQDGKLCEDIDECTKNSDGCSTISETCVNTDGSYSCDCATEFTLDTDDNICKIDCESGFIRHSNNTACVECQKGYEISEDGKSCDIICASDQLREVGNKGKWCI